MTTPKLWTYYNDGERCGIVLSVSASSPQRGEGFIGEDTPSALHLAQRDDVICVSTGDVLVEPGEPAFVVLSDDMCRGWTNDADEPMVLLAGTFLEATEDRAATDGGHLAIVKLGGMLFSREAEVAHRARLAEHEDRERAHIDWTDPPAMQSVEVTQALAFMRYVAFSRKLDEVGLESDAADALREMDAPWYEMTQETQELAAWAIADGRSTPHEQTSPTAAEPVSLRDIIAAFPGVISVDVNIDHSSPDRQITAKIQAGAAFNVVEFQDYLYGRVPVITLHRLHNEVHRVAFICDVCKQETQAIGENEDMSSVCGQCWLAAKNHTVSSRVQAPTEPTSRDLVLQPLDEPIAAYWRAVQTARNAIDTALTQLTEARRLADKSGHAYSLWYEASGMINGLASLRKRLPDMPATGAVLDGGCANSGESGC